MTTSAEVTVTVSLSVLKSSDKWNTVLLVTIVLEAFTTRSSIMAVCLDGIQQLPWELGYSQREIHKEI